MSRRVSSRRVPSITTVRAAVAEIQWRWEKATKPIKVQSALIALLIFDLRQAGLTRSGRSPRRVGLEFRVAAAERRRQ